MTGSLIKLNNFYQLLIKKLEEQIGSILLLEYYSLIH
jgi:hypothetical protein